MSDSVRPHRQQPTRLPRPWDSPGKNTGVGCHFLLQCVKVKSESKVAQSCPTLSDPMDYSLPGPPSIGVSRQEYWSGVPLPSPTISWSLLRFMSIQSVMLSNHLFLCCPLLLLPSVFPSIRVLPISWHFSSGGFPGGSDGKESAYNVGDPGSIPGLGRSLGEGNGNPLQYSCLENSMD